MFGVLFVCTGNICRSPTAEAVFRHYVREEGLIDRFVIDSAGTHGYHIGQPPDSRTIAAAKKRGIDMSEQKARKVRTSDFQDFDLILAMDEGHQSILREIGPSERVKLFLDYAPETGLADVPDPYYGGPQDFEHVLDLVELGARQLLVDFQKNF